VIQVCKRTGDMPNNHYSAVVELARPSYSRVQPLFDVLAFHLSSTLSKCTDQAA
jgi:hypothetical protein